MDRRRFIRAGLSIGGAVLAQGGIAEARGPASGKEFAGVLVDTTRCIGCRRCEEACAKANGLPPPNLDDTSVFQGTRTMGTTAWTVVNRYETSRGPVYVKRQCMHCNQPSCTSACLVRAMLKTEEGPVIWRESKCMGCRYCMVSCPFDVPKFEYDRVVPKIQKCNMCFSRLKQGLRPACVEACPMDALMFGTRKAALENAYARIVSKPDRYHEAVYGESEVGGTAWLYLAGVPFDEIGFRTDLGTTAYPEYTKGFQYLVPMIYVLWPTFLMGICSMTRGGQKEERGVGQEAKKQ
ncbi:MAG: 4Fe-4S dicluster domain-containing protein [Acidobacteriota bacterium]